MAFMSILLILLFYASGRLYANEYEFCYSFALSAHVAKDDIGRVQAYGWSLPTANGQSPLQSVPVPVFCRPLDQNDPNPQLKVVHHRFSCVYAYASNSFVEKHQEIKYV